MITKTDRSVIPSTLPLTLLLLTLATPAAAQVRNPGPALPSNSPFLGGIPQGTVTAEPLRLSIIDSIKRSLEHNLGVLISEGNMDRARGARRVSLSELLPKVSARAFESRQKTNLEAFGFPLGATFPRIVGPFGVVDARVFLSQSVFDLHATNELRADGYDLAAAQLSVKGARDLVMLVTANLYLQTLASTARAQSARAQLETAQALYDQALDLKKAGIIAGIDVLRAEVRLGTERQRATSSENDFQKAKLQLARVIGLPLGQTFELIDQVPTVPMPDIAFDAALGRAYRERPDYLAALERIKAAEATRRAALSEALPSVRVTADYGAIGLTSTSALSTFNVAGEVNIPLFQGGLTQGRLIEAGADLRRRHAEAEDLRASIYYDVRTAFLDLQATGEELAVATRARELASQQLAQSRDRFGAGVAINIEVVQAQEAVAAANEQYISALYGFNLAKAMLAASVGGTEETLQKYLGGSN